MQPTFHTGPKKPTGSTRTDKDQGRKPGPSDLGYDKKDINETKIEKKDQGSGKKH